MKTAVKKNVPQNSEQNFRGKDRPGFQKNFRAYITQFASKTSVHGIQYMAEEGRSMAERIFWLVFCSISVYLCAMLIQKTWMKWDQVGSISQKPAVIWQVPFPAITVCPQTKIKRNKYNFSDYYLQFNFKNVFGQEINITEEELKKYSYTSLVCLGDSKEYMRGDKIVNFDTILNLTKLAPSFEETFSLCLWKRNSESCSELFYPTLTEEGLCYTFNMLDRSEFFTEKTFLPPDYMNHSKRSEGWTLENGYPKNIGKDTFPKRASSIGFRSGVTLILLTEEIDWNHGCREPWQGFKIALHHPGEIPKLATEYYRIPVDQDVLIIIKPNMITTSPGLRYHDPQKRQCFFNEERSLAFFRIYTQQNCRVECIANYTLQKCGCVNYYMPRMKDTKICGPGSRQCTQDAYDEIIAAEAEYALARLNSEDSNNLNLPKDCICLPSCTSITYDTELMSHSDLISTEISKNSRYRSTNAHRSRLQIFFKDMNFIMSIRNELFGPTDFIANCGAFLGLFTGFSFLSVVEIIYFLTLRLICNVRNYGFSFWSGSKDLINEERKIISY